MADDPQGEQQIPDLGEPTSYLALGHGVAVYSSDGARLGKVVEVLKEERADVFDGIIFDTTAGPGGHKFVDGPEVGEIHDKGVVLKLTAEEAAKLPKPSPNPGALKVDPSDLGKSSGGGLRRFWDRLSGK
jgi:hypothetical protein